MKNTITKLFGAACLLIWTQASLAGDWGQDQSVDLVYLHPGANGALITQEVMVNPDGCSLSDYYVLNKTNINYDEIYSLLLAARIAGLPVQLYVSGCYYSRPVISLAQL